MCIPRASALQEERKASASSQEQELWLGPSTSVHVSHGSEMGFCSRTCLGKPLIDVVLLRHVSRIGNISAAGWHIM